MQIDQAALTGESIPAKKFTGDVAFSGSAIKMGERHAVVYATGAWALRRLAGRRQRGAHRGAPARAGSVHAPERLRPLSHARVQASTPSSAALPR
jgi:hypothetical protein